MVEPLWPVCSCCSYIGNTINACYKSETNMTQALSLASVNTWWYRPEKEADKSFFMHVLHEYFIKINPMHPIGWNKATLGNSSRKAEGPTKLNTKYFDFLKRSLDG